MNYLKIATKTYQKKVSKNEILKLIYQKKVTKNSYQKMLSKVTKTSYLCNKSTSCWWTVLSVGTRRRERQGRHCRSEKKKNLFTNYFEIKIIKFWNYFDLKTCRTVYLKLASLTLLMKSIHLTPFNTLIWLSLQIGKTKYGTKYGPHKTLGREKTGGKH